MNKPKFGANTDQWDIETKNEDDFQRVIYTYRNNPAITVVEHSHGLVILACYRRMVLSRIGRSKNEIRDRGSALRSYVEKNSLAKDPKTGRLYYMGFPRERKTNDDD